MIKNVTEINGNSEKSELDVMTFHDVIPVANEKREGRCDALACDKLTNENARENLYIQYLCLCQDQSVEQVGIPAQHLNQ